MDSGDLSDEPAEELAWEFHDLQNTDRKGFSA